MRLRGRRQRVGWAGPDALLASTPTGVLQQCGYQEHAPPALFPRNSERLARSQAEGQRQKEACNINKSLSSLGDVFQVRRGYHFLFIDCPSSL